MAETVMTGEMQEGGGVKPRTSGAQGPWALAFRKLTADRAAMVALAALALITLVCIAAPLYATWSHTDPFRSNLDGQVMVDGKLVPALEQSSAQVKYGLKSSVVK